MQGLRAGLKTDLSQAKVLAQKTICSLDHGQEELSKEGLELITIKPRLTSE